MYISLNDNIMFIFNQMYFLNWNCFLRNITAFWVFERLNWQIKLFKIWLFVNCSVGWQHCMLIGALTSVLAATLYSLWQLHVKRLEMLWWYANSLLHNLHTTLLLSTLPLGIFISLKFSILRAKHCHLIHVVCCHPGVWVLFTLGASPYALLWLVC